MASGFCVPLVDQHRAQIHKHWQYFFYSSYPFLKQELCKYIVKKGNIVTDENEQAKRKRKRTKQKLQDYQRKSAFLNIFRDVDSSEVRNTSGSSFIKSLRVHREVWCTRAERNKLYYERRSPSLEIYVEWELWSLICNLHSVGEAARQTFGCSENESSYIWWPNISDQLEQLAKACIESQLNQSMPNKAPLHPWKWATVSWQRIYIDYKVFSWSIRRRQ